MSIWSNLPESRRATHDETAGVLPTHSALGSPCAVHSAKTPEIKHSEVPKKRERYILPTDYLNGRTKCQKRTGLHTGVFPHATYAMLVK